MESSRMIDVAIILYSEAYESSFGGKERGRFLISRSDLKQLLDVPRLHAATLAELTDACLDLGLVMIDMDETFAFAEANFVAKWRKLPSRLVNDYVNKLKESEEALDGVVTK